jgi:tripartite-type tricarboxylate transporter receptor subunit TctC
MKIRALLSLLIVAVVALSQHATAQSTYPNKPIKLLVPYPAGGGGDAIARILTQQMSKTLGQPFVLDFKPGADTQIATSEVMRAPADGYTLLLGNAAGLSFVPAMRKVQPYDAMRDFTPISSVLLTTFGIFVHPSVPAKTLRELVAYAKANPGKLSYGTPTASAVLLAAVFLKDTGTNMVHIPFKGDAQAVTELLAGRIEMVVGAPGAYQQHVDAGKLRALAVTSTARASKLPDVPTFTEAGFPPMKVKSWNGLLGPAGMPKDIVDKLSRAVQAATAREDVRTQLEAIGFVATGSTPEELGSMMKEQLDVWKGAVQQAGLVPE